MILGIQFFFLQGYISPALNFKFMVLISKVMDAMSIDQFQLIMLSNFLFKLILIFFLDNCVAGIAHKVISSNQFNFIRCRSKMFWW